MKVLPYEWMCSNKKIIAENKRIRKGNAKLRKENAELKKRVAELEAIVKKLLEGATYQEPPSWVKPEN